MSYVEGVGTVGSVAIRPHAAGIGPPPETQASEKTKRR